MVSNEFHNMLIHRYLYSLNFALKDYCFCDVPSGPPYYTHVYTGNGSKFLVSLNGVDEYSTRGLYFPDNVLRLYRETPTSENMQQETH